MGIPTRALELLIVAVAVISMVGMPQFSAARSFLVRFPDGTVALTGRSLKLPYRHERKLLLREHEEQAREDQGQITETGDYLEAFLAEDDSEVLATERKYGDIVDEKGRKFKVSPQLIHAVIEAESSYDPQAISHAGAVGLMQLMPATADRFGVTDRTNPEQNIDGGARYLRFLLDFFSNDLRLALAGYNAGEGAVLKYDRQVPPYPETRDYVTKVLRFLQRNLKQDSPHASSPIVAQLEAGPSE